MSPWLLGATALLAAFVLSWLATVIEAFRHIPGQTGQNRVLQFFGLGTVGWAGIILLGVALMAAGRRFELTSAAGPLQNVVAAALFVAAAIVGISALIDILVELANFGHGIAQALSGLVGYLAALPVAAATGWWAYRLWARKS
jgi:hypothetical protein